MLLHISSRNVPHFCVREVMGCTLQQFTREQFLLKTQDLFLFLFDEHLRQDRGCHRPRAVPPHLRIGFHCYRVCLPSVLRLFFHVKCVFLKLLVDWTQLERCHPPIEIPFSLVPSHLRSRVPGTVQ